MEVSRKGHMVYAFPRDIERRARRLEKQRRPLLSRARTAAQASIGLMLLASVAAIRPLLGRDSDAQRLSLRRELRALRQTVLAEPPQQATGDDTADSDGLQEEEQRQLEQCLSLACYAFMFGDDGGRAAVAAERRERQFAAIAGCIRANKGAVCAEQLRPFLLDLPRGREPGGVVGDASASWLTPVEPWLLPVLHRFDGRPVATDDGELVFTFPELLPTTSRDRRYGLYPTSAPLVRGARSVLRRLSGPSAARFDYLEEPLRTFTTYADEQTQRRVLAIAGANWCAIVLLGALLGPLQLCLRSSSASRGAATLALVNAAYGGLLVNGLAWLLLPTARRLDVCFANWAVRSGNRRRRRLAEEVLAAETPLAAQGASRLARGLRAAKKLRMRGRGNEVVREEVLYTTAKDLIEQAETQQPTVDAWDAELQRKVAGGYS